ncbi:MAG: hypothetical protein ACHQ1H_00825 [Nitrososphaerales archaeon]
MITDTTTAEVGRPTGVAIAGIFTIIVGILGFIDSYFILASPLIFGWLIIGGIGFVALFSGIGLFTGADWAYGGATLMCLLSLFAGFIEIIGYFDPYLRISGWASYDVWIGVGTLASAAIALAFLYSSDVVAYFT